eukprot:c32417_g1_i1.p1 GENE.c32417_g1_i1~~c32417_g1_i1.p1  ORF type:complete len:433 (+),score=72.23 c32417_g1_i1:36-1334(+)
MGGCCCKDHQSDPGFQPLRHTLIDEPSVEHIHTQERSRIVQPPVPALAIPPILPPVTIGAAHPTTAPAANEKAKLIPSLRLPQVDNVSKDIPKAQSPSGSGSEEESSENESNESSEHSGSSEEDERPKPATPVKPPPAKVPTLRVGVVPALATPPARTEDEVTDMSDEKQVRAMRQTKLDAEDAVCSKVADRVYLGSNTVAKNRELLDSFGITHVVNTARSVSDNYFESELRYLEFALEDGPAEDLTSVLYDAIEFVDNALANDGNVLVHCWQGVSRSTSIVIAWMMFHNPTMSFDDCLQQIRETRSIARPNAAFMCQLLDWGLRRKNGAKVPRLCRVQALPDVSSRHLVARQVFRFTRADLQSNTAVVLQCPAKDGGDIYVWVGSDCPPDFEEKATHHAARLQNFEHGGQVITTKQGEEPEEFWRWFEERS